MINRYFTIGASIGLFILLIILGITQIKSITTIISPISSITKIDIKPTPLPTPTPSPTPSPSPLTFAQMNLLYGPCTYIPTLMYHHIEDLKKATEEKHAFLAVDTTIFHQQMQYLKDKGYTIINMQQLINFFDIGTALPAKPILLTFDDGYLDFISDALPILKEFRYAATLFLPTGLVENPGYVSWSSLNDAQSNKVLIANHTWSHHSVATDQTTIEKEITTADTQLNNHGYDSPKVFAYPYGNSDPRAVAVLQKNNYVLAFTTIPGSTLCKKQRLTLPRVRIGNTSLSAYGF